MFFINIYPCFFCFPFLQSLKCLKRIDLRGSNHLIRIPDFSNAENLCYLNLEECSCLEEISWLVEAKSESTILDLRLCRSLRRLLEIPYNIKELYLNKNTIEQLPEKIGSVKGLQRLALERCSRLASLPDSICDLNIEYLDVSNCVNLHQLPKNIGNLQNLRKFYANKSGIQELPNSINQVHILEILDCSNCKGLKLPPLNSLLKLQEIRLEGCYMAEFPEGLCSVTSLRRVNLSRNDFRSISDSINKLSKLEGLYLNDCKRLEVLPQLPSALQILEVSNYTYLESVSIAVLPGRGLVLDNCINLKQEDSTIIIEHVLRRHLSNDERECELWIIGNEVPERMIYKNESGSCLSITLNPYDQLIGFSLCVILASSAYPLHGECSAILTDLFGFSHHESYDYYGNGNSQSESLLLRYQNTSQHIGAISKATFCFYNEVLKCGIYPIFEGSRENDKTTSHYRFQIPSLVNLRQSTVHLCVV